MYTTLKGSHIRFLHSTVLRCLGYIARLGFTLRWEGMAASTNCSSNVNCCATLRTYLAQFVVHREQRSTLTEERNSRTACSSKVNYVASRRCACFGKRYGNIRACAMDRSRTLFRLFSRHISGTQSFQENRHINIHLLVVHNPLVPLIGRLVV